MTKTLTPQEFEQQLLQHQTAPDYNPLDSQAAMFFLYLPRFQGSLNFMSKKELQTLIFDLANSDYNKIEDTSKLLSSSKSLNLKGLRRTISAVIESPLQNETLKLLSKQEKNLFTLLDGLLTNKYYNCIKTGLEEKAKNNEFVEEIETIILHKVDTTGSGFKKRSEAAKNSFAIGSKLLASKFLMIMITHDEVLSKMEKEI